MKMAAKNEMVKPRKSASKGKKSSAKAPTFKVVQAQHAAGELAQVRTDLAVAYRKLADVIDREAAGATARSWSVTPWACGEAVQVEWYGLVLDEAAIGREIGHLRESELRTHDAFLKLVLAAAREAGVGVEKSTSSQR